MKGRVPRSREQMIRAGVRADRIPAPVRVGGRAEVGEIIEPPMPLKDAALEFWQEVVPELQHAGLIERVDRFILCLAAQAWGQAVLASRVLEVQGQVARGSMGQMREHPAVKTLRDATASFDRCAQNVALTPVARARLGLAALTAASMTHELDELIGNNVIADAEVVEDASVGLPGT